MNPIELTGIIPSFEKPLRVDSALVSLFPNYSRTRIQQWIASGFVLIDGQIVRAKDKARPGALVSIHAPLAAELEDAPEAIELEIVHEDAHLLVVNKPVGLVVHPGAGCQSHTLVNALLHHDPTLAHLPRAGLIHRLDKDTSGLLVVARTLAAHQSLVSQLQAHTMGREYLAIVQGTMISGGSVSASIGRHPHQRLKMAVTARGKPAITHYRISERFCAHTAVTVRLETGRTHQIRVHLTHLGYPIVGDQTYCKHLSIPRRCSPQLIAALLAYSTQALHAKVLSFIHPESGESLRFESQPPHQMEELLQLLRSESSP